MPFAATWMDLEIIVLRKTNIIWYHLYVESKKWTNQLIYKTETDTQTENKLIVTKGEKREVRWGGRDKLGVWDEQIHTTIYKMDKQQGPTV